MTPKPSTTPRQTPRPGSRALVHIGLNKTGTTTIQSWLATNADVLARKGYRYDSLQPKTPGRLVHIHGFSVVPATELGKYFNAPTFRARFGIRSEADQKAKAVEFRNAAEASMRAAAEAGETYVISSEMLEGRLRNADLVAAFHDWVSSFFETIDYVVYFREQTSWVASAYSEHLKVGSTDTLDTFIAKRGARDFYRTAQLWSGIVGRDRLNIRLMAPDMLAGQDALADFAALLGIDLGETVIPPRKNEAIDAGGLSALMRLNRIIAPLPNELRFRVRNVAVAALTRLSARRKGRKGALTDEQRKAVLDAVARSNEALRREFFPERASLFASSAPAHRHPAAAGQPKSRNHRTTHASEDASLHLDALTRN